MPKKQQNIDEKYLFQVACYLTNPPSSSLTSISVGVTIPVSRGGTMLKIAQGGYPRIAPPRYWDDGMSTLAVLAADSSSTGK
uniref:Uncharacterized protein n=1 Tax=Solanum lycopersicum TaxID=4081 RepID=A0A3Q7JXL7_SOLLC